MDRSPFLWNACGSKGPAKWIQFVRSVCPNIITGVLGTPVLGIGEEVSIPQRNVDAVFGAINLFWCIYSGIAKDTSKRSR